MRRRRRCQRTFAVGGACRLFHAIGNLVPRSQRVWVNKELKSFSAFVCGLD